MKYYKISEGFLKDLLTMAHTYQALESWGVDNWIGWGEAQREYINDCSIIDETNYECIKDIVDADIATMEVIQ